MRIACVQNGDYTTAARNLATGGPETYNGQFYTVREFQRFAGDVPSLVVSLDAPPHEQVLDGGGLVAAVAAPRPPVMVPRRLLAAWHARRVIRRLEAFGPTHLLLRCLDVIGCELLAWADARRIPVGAIIAARFDPAHAAAARFCRLANDANVVFVANHNRVATESLVACGLDAGKAVAWDLPPAATPDQFAPRRRDPSEPLSLLFAGVVEPAKGVEELVKAAELCRAAGRPVRLLICGDGSLLEWVRRHPAAAAGGWLRAPGRLPQQEVLRQMTESDLVVVPSRAAFPEGLPFVIQEALAVRTPLVLSSHPVFVRYFRDGQGVRFFNEGDARSLSALLLELEADPAGYARLSEQTAGVWEGLQCPLKFHHLLDRLARVWGLPARAAAHTAEAAEEPVAC